MPKAINWPEKFLAEVLAEDLQSLKVALRLGSIYYDNNYYQNGEIVDIRVNHKVVRQGQIIGSMKLCKISELTSDDLLLYKENLNSKEAIKNFLSDNYQQLVNDDTIVTVIHYRNLDIERIEDTDDPHM